MKYSVQGVATHLIYDGDDLILEIKNGSITNRYVHTGTMGTPAVSYTGSTVGTANRQFLHKNHQGSVIAATNNSGNASYINTYDAYGVPGNNNQGRFAYTGQLYLAELGLYHYRARTYAPKLGRFLQTDPIGYEDQMNLYAYVGNDPMTFTDPTGMQTFYGCTPSGATSWSCGGNSGSNNNAKDDSAAQKGFGSGRGSGAPLTDEQKAAFNDLNGRIRKLDSFESEAQGMEWIEKNVYPLSVDHGVELGVNLYKDIGYRLNKVVTDYSRGSLSNSTLFGGISLSNLSVSWHSHPGSNSLGASPNDIRQAQQLKVIIEVLET